MRRIIFILLIALLPLRGWAGEAMATQMAIESALSQVHNTSNFAAVKNTRATMSPECALRMNMATDDKGVVDKVCVDCQACHMIALAEPVQASSKFAVKLAFEVSAATYFASAEPQFSQKPPIFFA